MPVKLGKTKERRNEKLKKLRKSVKERKKCEITVDDIILEENSVRWNRKNVCFEFHIGLT